MDRLQECINNVHWLIPGTEAWPGMQFAGFKDYDLELIIYVGSLVASFFQSPLFYP